MSDQANRGAGALLTPTELDRVSGGMIKLNEEKPTPTGDEGTTWVPYGTVKVYLGGVQIN